MAYEQRDNSGSLFKNDKKETDAHPNMRGKAMIGGRMYWVSAWTKKKTNDEKWISLSFKEFEGEKVEPKKEQKTAGKFDDMADDIPF